MRLYRVNYADDASGHQGFSWHPSKADAQRAVAEYMRDNKPKPKTGDAYDDMYGRVAAPDRPMIELIDVGMNKKGILVLLNTHAVHPDNG